MITYPVSKTDRFTFKSGGKTVRNMPWPRDDGQRLEGDTSGLVILQEVIGVKPSFDPNTQKLTEGWFDDDANQLATWTYTVVSLSVEELALVALNAADATKRTNLASQVATLRSWAANARSTTVTSGNAVATLQVVVNRLGVFFDSFADFIEIRIK